MLELRRPSARLTTGLAIALLLLVEVHSLAGALGAQEQLRDRLTRSIGALVELTRPQLAAALAPGDAAALAAALREARATNLAAEAALLSLDDGRVLAADPPLAALEQTLSPEAVDLLHAGGSLSVGPIVGAPSRLVSYLGLRWGNRAVAVRLATPVPELVQDLRERRTALLGHGVALVLLALAAGLLLFPDRGAGARPAPAGVYEAAMERLHELALKDQQQLRRVEGELREKAALARSGELAAGIAHEMRNGIATIQGYARLVETSTDAPARDSAAAIAEECRTLAGVITRFMDYVKDERLNPSRFELRRLLSRVAARESRSRPGATVELAGLDSLELHADEELLERAFENLVRNAREAAGPGGRVRVEVARDGADALVTVFDDGPGLTVEADAIRPFFTTKPGGFGLGLPMAYKITLLHDGALRLGPSPLGGLAATVRLPLTGSAVQGSLPNVTPEAEADAHAEQNRGSHVKSDQ